MNDNVDAARIAEVLNRHGVRYVVIGGFMQRADALRTMVGPFLA